MRDLPDSKHVPLEVDKKDENDPPAIVPTRPRPRFFVWPFTRRSAATASKPSRENDLKTTRDELKEKTLIAGDPPRADPAAESALKRTLEKRIAEVSGDRLKEMEVLVIDRRVIIRVRVNRFWQRGGVRKAIESLQELAGYRSSVDVN